MAKFSKGIRGWWLKVSEYCDGFPRDQTLIYSEEGGFRQSCERADEVHHIIPGTYAETVLGQRANDQIGMPVSRAKHNGGGTTLPYCQASTFHKDVDEARKKYRRGDKEAFEKARQKHKQRAERGGRYWGGDEASDEYYRQIMEQKAVRYVAETGNKKPESGKPIPRKKHWSDGLFD